LEDISFENIGLSRAAKAKNPLKQAHCISGVTLLVIDESHVQRLAIKENGTWFEQISFENGILLKIRGNRRRRYLVIQDTGLMKDLKHMAIDKNVGRLLVTLEEIIKY
jgi:hypothetical protein